jgi:hypothetical protein
MSLNHLFAACISNTAVGASWGDFTGDSAPSPWTYDLSQSEAIARVAQRIPR